MDPNTAKDVTDPTLASHIPFITHTHTHTQTHTRTQTRTAVEFKHAGLEPETSASCLRDPGNLSGSTPVGLYTAASI